MISRNLRKISLVSVAIIAIVMAVLVLKPKSDVPTSTLTQAYTVNDDFTSSLDANISGKQDWTSVTSAGAFSMGNCCASGMAWSPDGKMLALGFQNTVRLWRIDGKPGITMQGHSDKVTSVAWSPDGQNLASGSLDGTVRLWSSDGKFVKLLTTTVHDHHMGSTPKITSMSWTVNKDSALLATGSNDGTIELWQSDGQLLTAIPGDHMKMGAGNIESLKWSADNKLIAYIFAGEVRIVWANHRQRTTIKLPDATTIAWSPDGQSLITGSDNGVVRTWNVDGKQLNVMQGHSASVTNVSWSPDGKTLAPASADKTVRLWDAKTGKLVNTLTGRTALFRTWSGRPMAKRWPPLRLTATCAFGNNRRITILTIMDCSKGSPLFMSVRAFACHHL